MQLAQDTNVMQSNVITERKKFAISDMTLVMSLLTKMYSNPIQTLTQEYICNGRDANREVRQSRKMEITGPTRFSPNMIIRDFGPGITPDRIDNVFLFYGNSTKRHTNKQTGGFGIGGKSAWAYTDSFTITTYVDGVKRVYIAHKSAGQGNLDLISESETKEPNGTAIEIAVKPNDCNAFRNAVLRTIYFWNENEKPVLKGFEQGEVASLGKNIILDKFKEILIYNSLPHYMNGHKFAIIDGIAYPLRINMDKINKLVRHSYAIILNTGDVEIAPNREEFVQDNISTNLFTQLDDTLQTKIKNYINSEINQMPSVKDGLKRFLELYNNFQIDGKYKNYVINYHGISVANPKAQGYHDSMLNLGINWEFLTSKTHKRDFQSLPTDKIDSVLYDDMPTEPAVKKVWRIRKFNKHGRVYVLNNDQSAIATDLDATLLSSIDATDYKVQRQAKAAIQKQEVCLHYFEGRGTLNPTQTNLSNVTNTIVYATMSDELYDKRHNSELIAFIAGLKGHQFAFVAEAAVSKITKNSKFIWYKDFYKNYTLSDKQIEWYNHQRSESDARYLQHLKPIAAQIKDPVLAYFVNLMQVTYNESQVSYVTPKDLIDANHKLIKECTDNLAVLKKFDTRYPMLFRLLDYGALDKNAAFRQDVLSYLNRKYKEASK